MSTIRHTDGNTFQRIYDIVKKIPAGHVATYGMVAALAGNPRMSRVVGHALHFNPDPGTIPCFRVVNRFGECSGSFAFGGKGAQEALLLEDGVKFLPDGRVDLRSCLWQPDSEEYMAYGFSALFSRMNFIDRWGLMRNSRKETLSEHSAVTACIAHVMAVTAKERFGAEVSPEKVAVAALYHDISETLTGDMPTPVKYRDDDIRDSYKRVEKEAEKQVSGMLPDDLRDSMSGYITGDVLNEREHSILKAADKVSALIKCIEERRSGNTEFTSAEESTLIALDSFDLPELRVFLDDFLPSHSATLDELIAESR